MAKSSTSFKPGNEMWKRVSIEKLGRPNRFKTPEDLFIEALEYFQYCEDNPIETKETTEVTEKGLKTKGTSKIIEHKRPYTWGGLYIYLSVASLEHYKTKPEFSDVLGILDEIIRAQKFEGAANGIFNANIIARDLGLKDNSDINFKGELVTDKLSKEERKARIAELVEKAKK